MTIHTIWGDFESEEELIKTGARMMGISYNKAKAIREKALKEHEEERKRIERAIQERKDLEKSPPFRRTQKNANRQSYMK